MAFTIRRAEERGGADLGWLNSKHTFSFGHYYDPKYLGFGPLRVINEDRIAPGGGFPTHPHSDMEIISYVLDGAMEHRDSLGTGSVIKSGDIQRMSAGTGVRHSEYNASNEEQVHFLQIWIVPEREGLEPSYEQKTFPRADKHGKLLLIGSRNGRDGSITIHRDVDLYASILTDGESTQHEVREGRGIWVQVTAGTLSVNGVDVRAGDGLSITGQDTLRLLATEKAEFLLFDLAY